MKNIKKIIEVIAVFMILYILITAINNPITIIDNILVILFVIMVFLLIHFIRMIRIYILLVEEKIPIKEFIKLYIKTTFINTIIPFKLGEFYKMICYGEKLKSFSAGLSLVWIDRFFDSLILLVLMIVASGFNSYSLIYVILVLFIVFSVLVYLTFENTYKYFNTLVLEKGKSKRSKFYLEVIDETKKVYNKAKNMVKFRSIVLIILSTLIWGLEYLLANLILKNVFNMDFNLKVFTDYINDIFMIFNTKYSDVYKFNILIMIFAFVIIYVGLKIIGRKKNNG